MKSNSRVLRGWRDFGVKATAIILTILLATQMVGTPAFASGALTNKQASEDIAATVDDTGVEPSGTEATDTTVPDEAAGAANEPAPADSTQATEEPVVETVESATEPATETPAADPAANTVLGAEPEPAPAPAVEQDQLASIELNLADGASITLSKDGNKIDDDTNPVDVPANEELKFTAAAPEGMQVSAVRTAIDSVESDPIAADENGEYTIAAEDVTDELTVKVETSEVEGETPSEGEEAPAEDAAEVGDEGSSEGEKDADSIIAETNANEGISPLSVSGFGTEDNPYQIEPGDTYSLSESYNRRGEWRIKGPNDSDWKSAGLFSDRVSTGHATLSNINNGLPSIMGWGEDASATFELHEGDAAGTIYQVRYNSRIYYFRVADSTKATVSFYANGGWSAPESITVDKGGTVTIPTEEPSRYGHTFAGWSTDSNATSAEYQPGQQVTLNANMTLYAVRTQSATIAFEPNGGTGDRFTLTTTEGRDGSFKLSLPNPEDHGITREGYTFVGWSTDQSGTGLNYTPQEITVSDGQTYYAIWAENDPHGAVEAEFFLRIDGDIPFEPDANIGAGGAGYFPGGCGTGLEGTIKQAVAINNNLQLVADNILQAPSDETIISKIEEWNQTHSGNQTMSYDPATQEIVWYVIKKNDNHYHVDGVIQGKAVSRVTYDPNGGTSYVPTAKTYTEGTNVRVDFDTTPTRAGYTFLGWDIDKNAATPEYTKDGINTFVMPSNDVTLYAIWRANNSTGYTVEHYTVNSSGDAKLYKEEEKSGKTDTTATAAPIEIPGYTFDEDHEGTVLSGTITGDGSLVLKLYYTANEDSLSYEANGGTGEMQATEGYVGEDVTVAANGFERTGYKFAGWDTQADGQGEDYAAGASYTLTEGDDVLYAQWEAVTDNLSVAGYSEVYDGDPHGVTVNNALDTDEIRYLVDGNEVENSFTDVTEIDGTEVAVEVYRDGVKIWSDAATVTITARPVTASGSVSKVYDGSAALLEDVALTPGAVDGDDKSGVVGDDDVVVGSIAAEVASYAKAEKHENLSLITENEGGLLALTGLSGDDAANYKLVSVTATGTITAQSITPGPDSDPDPSYGGIEISDPSDQVYNGDYQLPEIAVTDSEGNSLQRDVDYTVTYGNNVNVTSADNPATVIVRGIGNYSGEVVKTFQITPAEATVVVNDSSKVYGEADPTESEFEGGYNGYSVVLAGTDKPLYTNVESKTVDVLGSIKVVRPEAGIDENFGTYEKALCITISEQNPNYWFTLVEGDFTITKAGGNEVTISHDATAEGFIKTYDGAPISIEAAASKEGSTLLYSTDGQNWSETKPTLTNVGSLTIYVKATNPNYEDSPVVSATVQVTPATLTVTTDSLGKVFDGTALTAEGEVTGFVNNEAATFAVTGSQTEVGSSVNDYSLVFDQTAQQSNYTVVEDLGTLTVWPQSIDPTDPGENPDPDDPDAPDPTDPDPGYDPDDPDPEDPDQPFYTGIKVQGPDPQVYDAADQTPGVVVTDKNGKVLEEGTDYRITGYDNNYNATTEDSPAIIHVEGMGNYGGNIDVEFEIIPAPLKVTTPSAGKVYDGSALTAAPADVEGLQGGDAAAVTITATGTQTNVGNSVNGVSYDWGQVLASNYNITEDLGTLTVWPQSINPGDPDPDSPDPGDPDPTDPDPDFPGENPDPDNPVVPDQPFYTGAEVNDPESVPYDGNVHQWTPTVTDAEGNTLVQGEDYTVTYLDADGNAKTDFTNVTGVIRVVITGQGDYGGTVEKRYQITPLEIDVYIENQTKVEGEADPTFTFNYEGVLEGESMGWTGAFVRDAGEAAGTYNVAQGGFVLADNEAGNFLASNYTLTVHPGTLTITAAPVPPGPGDPDPVTPVTPLPTPDPTPVPTPTPGDPGATETTTTPATEEATETIEDDATPRTAPEPIDDDGTPLASGAHRDCWVHWLMLLGILVTVVYYGGVGVRRVRFSSSLQSFEDDVLGNDETNR